MKRTEINKILEAKPGGKYLVKAWVRTFRSNRFIALNDGSTIKNIQVVVDFENFDEELLRRITTGAAISVSGELVESQGKGQNLELLAERIEIIGDSPADQYPLQPKKHSLEFLREIAHLRPRTNTFSAVLRLRHALAYGIHKYFNDHGFYSLHSPIITGSDAEGAGEMFTVTTLPEWSKGQSFEEDFFGKHTKLTVSGQLEAELGALALSKVYTFGPTFRAENSNTTRHLAEFWMIEPEVAFNELDDNMDLAENFLKYLVNYCLENCADDLQFLSDRREKEQNALPKEKRDEKNLLDTLKGVLEHDFVRISYTEAFDILRNSKPNKKKKFQFPVNEWGVDLQSEHERYLVEKEFKKPVIIYNYPKEIKAFYMRQNDDDKTVGAMDILFPGIGEIVGGSQREERFDVLKKKIAEFNIPEEELWWYLDTRRFGSVPHSGFGLGFERLVLFVTGMTNVRDVIPFPRTPKNAEF